MRVETLHVTSLHLISQNLTANLDWLKIGSDLVHYFNEKKWNCRSEGRCFGFFAQVFDEGVGEG